MVPGSTFRYGSSFWMVSLSPRASSSEPMEAAASPLPSDDTTPPEMKMNFVFFDGPRGAGALIGLLPRYRDEKGAPRVVADLQSSTRKAILRVRTPEVNEEPRREPPSHRGRAVAGRPWAARVGRESVCGPTYSHVRVDMPAANGLQTSNCLPVPNCPDFSGAESRRTGSEELMKGALWGLIASTLLVTVASPSDAWAQKTQKVVVEKFSGPGTVRFRSMVLAVLAQRGADVVPNEKVTSIEADLGLLQVSDNYAAVAKELKVNAFLGGTITGKKRRVIAQLHRAGAHGKSLGQAAW